MFTKYLYVQVRENTFAVKEVSKPDSVQFHASAPFSAKRMLLGDFDAALPCLMDLIRKARGTWFPLLLRVIIHPMEKVEDGLTPVENRAFLELAEQAGAAEVIVWTGSQLSDSEALAKLKEIKLHLPK